MDSVTELFDNPASEELDVDLANASHALQKLAGEMNIDLSSLTDDEVAGLLRQLLPEDKVASVEHQPEESAQMPEQQEQQTQITDADVARELAKVAAANNIDWSQVSREEATEAYIKLAERMTSGEYFAEQAAREEEAQKLAEAKEQGVAMADGFLARLSEAGFPGTKVAEDMPEDDKEMEPEKKDKKDEEKEKEAAEKLAALLNKRAGMVPPVRKLEALGEAVRSAANKTRMGKKLVDKATSAMPGTSYQKLRRVDKALGGAAAVGGAGAAGLAASKAMGGKKKEALDQYALKLAADLLEANGINPATGELIEQDQDKVAEITSDEIANRAVELLQEAGWIS